MSELREEYKRAIENITPDQELIEQTIQKAAEQKRRGKLIQLCIKVAVAACLCVVLGIGLQALQSSPSVPGSLLAGSVFGKSGSVALPLILFGLITFVLVFVYRRKKK